MIGLLLLTIVLMTAVLLLFMLHGYHLRWHRNRGDRL